MLDGKIIPVLDGLDETPPALHAEVINALDQAVAGGRPVVVTCRSTEYELAVTRSGSVLAQAAVVEIEAVRLEDAIAYLTARARVGETRWDPLVGHLHRHRCGALARALRTPLMVDLARTAYAHPGTVPAELCDTARFAEPESIEEHLLDAYLPAAYAPRQAPPLVGNERHPRRRTYDQNKARLWLGFLAQHLEDQQTHEIAWWRLNHAVALRTTSLYLSLPPAILFAVAGQVAVGPIIALVYGFRSPSLAARRTASGAIPERCAWSFGSVERPGASCAGSPWARVSLSALVQDGLCPSGSLRCWPLISASPSPCMCG